MATYQYLVTVSCETREQADQVMIERLNYDEEIALPTYSDDEEPQEFDYAIDWDFWSEAETLD